MFEAGDKPKQTLFEAAKDAPDGTRFKLGRTLDMGAVYVKENGALRLEADRENSSISNLSWLESTDFEIIPSGPQKAEKIPAHLVKDYNGLQKMIAELLKWEGAKLNQLGWAMNTDTGTPFKAPYAHPLSVTFETSEQCLKAWNAEHLKL